MRFLVMPHSGTLAPTFILRLMDRLGYADQGRQHAAESIVPRIAEGKVKVAVQRVQLFIDALLGFVGLEDAVRRANFLLRLLYGLERSGG